MAASLILVGTAVLSALLTGAFAFIWFRLKLKAELDTEMKKIQAEFEQRVKQGVLAAGEELLPQLREQVSLGFQDALAKSQAAGLVEGAAGAVSLGADILGTGLSAFLGIKPRK